MNQEIGKCIFTQIANDGVGGTLLQEAKGVPKFVNNEVSSVEKLKQSKNVDKRVPKFDRNEMVSRNENNLETMSELGKKLSPFSENVNDHIRSDKESDLYQKLGLEERSIDGKEALTSNEINPDRKDAMGRTNMSRMTSGLAPLDKSGDSFNLHHIGQKSDSPLAELTAKQHQENSSLLHNSSGPTEVHGKDSNWGTQKANYWKARANDFK